MRQASFWAGQVLGNGNACSLVSAAHVASSSMQRSVAEMLGWAPTGSPTMLIGTLATLFVPSKVAVNSIVPRAQGSVANSVNVLPASTTTEDSTVPSCRASSTSTFTSGRLPRQLSCSTSALP